MDDFTKQRIISFIASFKSKNGRDPSKKDIISEGVSESDLKKLVSKKILKKYSATVGSGANENRYKLLVDPFSINKI